MKKIILLGMMLTMVACSSHSKVQPYSGYSTAYHNWLDSVVEGCYQLKIIAATEALKAGATEPEAIWFSQQHYLKCLAEQGVVF